MKERLDVMMTARGLAESREKAKALIMAGVVFVDGTRGVTDLSALIHSEDAGVFASLRDPALFSRARVVYGAVTWPGEIDLAPDALYRQMAKAD